MMMMMMPVTRYRSDDSRIEVAVSIELYFGLREFLETFLRAEAVSHSPLYLM